jgi:hypothetical protein
MAKVLAAAVLVAGLLMLPSSSDAVSGDVGGTVTDVFGPVEGVLVRLVTDEGLAGSTSTASDGTYRFEDVPDASYRVSMFDPTGRHLRWWSSRVLSFGDSTPIAEATVDAELAIFGFSGGGATDPVGISEPLGVRFIRPTLGWRQLQPVAAVEGLTVADLRADATLVADWADTADWTSHDLRVSDLVDAGIEPVPIVGHGYSTTLPDFGAGRATPDALGRQEYLAQQYRQTRAVVERYDADGVDDAPGSPRIALWQTENELNQAFLTAVFGWRSPGFTSALGSAWQDWAFLTDLLSTLRLAVLDADPTARTVMNFHTDVHEGIGAAFGVPSWQASITDWSDQMDVIGFDAYPNYYESQPQRGSVVGERVAEVVALAEGKPVMVIETGYPTGPSELGFNAADQAVFLEEALESSVAAGAEGFFWFGMQTHDTHTAVITQEDVDNLAMLGDLFESGDADALLAFIAADPDYVQNQLGVVLQSVEGYWGIVAPDDTPKPAWHTLDALLADDLPDDLAEPIPTTTTTTTSPAPTTVPVPSTTTPSLPAVSPPAVAVAVVPTFTG